MVVIFHLYVRVRDSGSVVVACAGNARGRRARATYTEFGLGGVSFSSRRSTYMIPKLGWGSIIGVQDCYR